MTIYQSIAEIVYQQCGIVLDDSKKVLMEARLAKRLRLLALKDMQEYLAYLKVNPDEISALVDAISTNVTSFFRENAHFNFLIEHVSKEYKMGRRKFRLWSAACSTGEEPYTLAISLLEALPPHCDIKILATDISSSALQSCIRGRYRVKQLEPLSQELLERYFDRVEAGQHYDAKACLKSLLLVRPLNLCQPVYPMKGSLDYIFCRNVMIYFDRITKQRLLTKIENLLRPGGLFMLGHAENLTGLKTSMTIIKPAIYRKAAPHED
ncbi:MAG: protein-glutamate O-methyltransferase CheR [Lentisphaeraceae bacterium]|nr:protein-glutamate O-methyltransferase CheR [Lentisphaeraceae bacterium]